MAKKIVLPQVFLDAFAKMNWPLNKNIKAPKQSSQS
jgi:hypothetical protein